MGHDAITGGDPPPTGRAAPHDHGGPAWWDPLSHRPAHANPETGPLLGVVGVLVGSNVIANEVLPSWAYIPWNIAVAGTLVWVARRWGRTSFRELGLSPDRLRSGLVWGGLAATAVAGITAIGALLPVTRELFHDDRAADLSLGGLAAYALVEIPLGTVLAEETMFRGVLPAMFRRRFAHRRNWAIRGDATAAVLFGLWHVLPSLDLAASNTALKDLPFGLGVPVAIAASVGATAAAGLGFTWLRNRSGSLAAPMLLHWAINGSGIVAAWIVQH
ncbi:MAG: CPBP family intramembrane metalloprotease [Microthrixaceae bacterium]|nr:CPBP family intramembrane metalloprotease [Microthrixaceae bacterium]